MDRFLPRLEPLTVRAVAYFSARGLREIATLCLVLAASVLPATPAYALITKSYVVSWFHMATYAYDGACPQGKNPEHVELWSRSLRELGYSANDIKLLLTGGKINGKVLQDIVRDRGKIPGKENTFAYPWSAPDPHIKTVGGRYAIGFNLDGRGDGPNAFEDPETHERGVDNELFRAYGCFPPYQVSVPERPQYEAGAWFQLTGAMPAWVLTVSGESLEKDGDVTVVLARALEKSMQDARGLIMADATYRIDPNPRSINVLRGKITNGVISIDPADLVLEAEPHWLSQLQLRKAHLRLKMDGGAIAGFVGGYTPWFDQFFIMSSNGYDAEEGGIDLPGLWYALERLADGPKDPKTGKSAWISSAFRLEAVPAIVLDPTSALAKATPRQSAGFEAGSTK